MGMGGTLAKYAGEGIHTHLVTATRGERGRFGVAAVRPELRVVGETREAELRAAAKELGIRTVDFLDYLKQTLPVTNPGVVVEVTHPRSFSGKPRFVLHIKKSRTEDPGGRGP